MKFYAVFFFVMAVPLLIGAQSSLDSNLVQKIEKDVFKLEKRLIRQLANGELDHSIQVDFLLEEYRIEEYMRRTVGDDWEGTYIRELLNAEHRFDGLMTRYYDILFNQLNQEDQIVLEESQVQWLAYRNMERELNKKVNPVAYGKSAIPIDLIAERFLDITKYRVAELVDYIVRMGE